MKTEQL